MDRRAFVGLGIGTAAAGLLGLPPVRAGAARRAADGIDWHDVSAWGLEGKGWAETARFYDRLPPKAEGLVPDRVWNLSRQSAGMSSFFRTDAPSIRVRCDLLLDRIALPHMPATGVSGIDLYGQHRGEWSWAGVARPTSRVYETDLVKNIDTAGGDGLRDWRIYLPLYNGVEKLEIGVPAGSAFEPVAPRQDKPVVFYGTSILHGASASRPGMAWPSIVGRRLGMPTINLGFSGSGKMEPELGHLLAEIDAAAYVVDCAPNMSPRMIEERAEPFVRILRAARPDLPIVLVEDRRYGYGWIRKASRDRNTQNAQQLKAAFNRLTQSGVPKLHYVESGQVLGTYGGEAMTDGSHPNDLGMMMYADALTPVLQNVLG